MHQHQERLDTYLRRYWPEKTKGEIRQLILQGSIKVNFRQRKPDYRVFKNDFITVKNNPFPELHIVPQFANPAPRTLYEDRWLIIVDKPSGLVMHQNFNLGQISVISDLLARSLLLSPPYIDVESNIVHRLDRPVSGVVMVVRDYYDAEHFKSIFRARQVYKEYRVIVHGHIIREHGCIDTPIRKHEHDFSRKMVADPTYFRSALTEYHVLGYGRNITECKVILHTGRTHQIRVHFESIGHPVLGDRLYNQRTTPSGKNNLESDVSMPEPSRILLHAHKLEFQHPMTGRIISVIAPIPGEFHLGNDYPIIDEAKHDM